MRRAILLALVLVFLVALPGCDFKVALPHGYEVWELDGGEALVVTPNHYTAVPPDVRSYAVIGDLVVGYAALPEKPRDHRPAEPTVRSGPGYFVLDTASGEAWDPLTKAEWLARLRALGITQEPPLRAI